MTNQSTKNSTQLTNSGPPPLLSQRRHSMSSAPTTESTPVTKQSQAPSYQTKPVQAPPLLSQRATSNSPLQEQEKDDNNSIRSAQKNSQPQPAVLQNLMHSEPESDASKSIRSHSRVFIHFIFFFLFLILFIS